MIPTLDETDRFVAEAHAEQIYGDWPNPDGTVGMPYVEHVRQVGRRLQAHGEWAVMAGLLHDVVEDTAVTFDFLRRLDYPEIVVEAVDAVTRRDGEDYPDLIRRAAAHPLGCLVKLADNRANSQGLHRMKDRDRAVRLFRRYTAARQVLEEASLGYLRQDGYVRYGPAVVNLGVR